MGELLALSWRAYPAAFLAVLGAGLAAAGLRMLARNLGRRRSAPEWALVYLHVFRRVVVGLALVGVGVGWERQVGWLFAASLCIGIGEFFESSYYLWVLYWARRRGILFAPAAPARAEA